MAQSVSTDLHIRIDQQLKSEAEAVFDDLGISPASAVSIFYKQVVMHGGFPFQVVKHYRNAPELDGMTPAEIKAELQKGMDDYSDGRVKTVDDVFAKMRGAQNEAI